MAGIAVDSPSDAAALHPGLFANSEQARKAMHRAAFNGQTLISSSYREMSVKSAAYRRTGSDRGWQRARWIAGDGATVLRHLEAVLGDLADWRPE